ncbi:GATOR complex protein WDR24-like isoform X4 [Adelges cooleyi]|uniref:GATOR complex protein WDR24-like isoform X4 n=1 Tax=Adelges cooleyi TaxID=133065 RepID=UPI00217FBCE0|nr:GATOR complex protein WDR24-like isoform X4 [Adelges cooleyi]
MEEKVCSDIKCWTDSQFYLGILKYLIFNMLRLFFCVTAYLMRKTSSIFERLSEKFKVVENLQIVKHEQSNEESPESNTNLQTPVNQNINNNKDIICLNDEVKDNEEISNNKLESEEILESISVKETPINQDIEKKEKNSLLAGNLDDTNDKIKNNVETLINNDNSSKETDNNEKININKSNEKQMTTVEKNDSSVGTLINNDNSSEETDNNEKININKSDEKPMITIEKNDSSPESKNLRINALRIINKTLKENVEADYRVINKTSKENEEANNRIVNKTLNNYEEANSRCINKTLKENEEAKKKLALDARPRQADKSLTNASRLKGKSPINYKSDNPCYERYESNRKERKQWPKQHRSERLNSSEHNCNNAKDPFYRNSRNQKDYFEKRDNRGRRTTSSTSSRNEKSIEILEVHDDIFNMPASYALARFISEDLQFSSDTALDLKYKYKCSYGELLDQHLKVGDVGVIKNNNQYIFFLVTKKKYELSVYFTDLEKALLNLLDQMKYYKLTKLAIFFCDQLQRYTVPDIKMFLTKAFSGTNISINICLLPVKGDVKHLPMIQRTNKNLWDMEPQTDIIMLINMEEMYKEHWHDEVIDQIDAKYPFKKQLINDINMKPMAPGEIRMYKINGEVLICVFVKSLDKDRDHYKSLEKAFNLIKTQLSGYRYLGLQQRSASSEYDFDIMSHQIILLRSVFNNQNAEIWLCGDNDSHKAMQYEQYQKIVKESIEANKIGYTGKKNFKSLHSDFKRGGVNSTGIVHVSLQRNGANNTPDATISPIIKTFSDEQELNMRNNTTAK